jgi:organic hydroperoxide reductase OsmC/OhrA
MEVLTKVSHTFTVSTKWNEDSHIGIINSERRAPIVFTTPPEFGGTNTEWSPEHLLAASLSSCYATTFFYFVKLFKIQVQNFSISTSMDLEKDHGGPFVATRFTLHPHIEFVGTLSQSGVDNLLAKAKKYCIISSSVKGEVIVEPEIKFVNG